MWEFLLMTRLCAILVQTMIHKNEIDNVSLLSKVLCSKQKTKVLFLEIGTQTSHIRSILFSYILWIYSRVAISYPKAWKKFFLVFTDPQMTEFLLRGFCYRLATKCLTDIERNCKNKTKSAKNAINHLFKGGKRDKKFTL